MTSDPSLSIHWPAILKLDGDNELMLLTLDDAGELLELMTTSNDQLIDSSAHRFGLNISEENEPALVIIEGKLALDELISWLKAHASLQGSCCVSKLGASSYTEAMNLAIAIIED